MTTKGKLDPVRREVIDVHCHVAMPDFPVAPVGSRNPCWPCTRPAAAAGAVELIINDIPFRRLDARSWDIGRRIEDMAVEGVTRQVLSPMPELLSYWFPADEAAILCDYVNNFIAEMVARRPDIFSGLGMIPLQDIAQAASMVRELHSRFGLLGVEVGSNIEGVYLGDRRFDAVWEEAQDAGMSVFVHALHPIATKNVEGVALFDQLAGFPADVGIAAASVIMSGVTARFPRLRIGFSHGGGALASMLGRLDMGWDVSTKLRQSCSSRPSDAARALFFDSNVYDPSMLKALATKIAPGHVFLGTDYPYASMQEGLQQYVNSTGLDDPALLDVNCRAAKMFLGINQ